MNKYVKQITSALIKLLYCNFKKHFPVKQYIRL